MPSTEFVWLAVRRMAFALLTLVLLPPAVFAHSVDSPRALHGGQARAMGTFHVELHVSDGQLDLYVYDRHNAPLWADSVKAHAQVLAAGGLHDLALAAGRRNQLSAPIPFKSSDVERVEITLADESGRSWTMAFTLAANAP